MEANKIYTGSSAYLVKEELQLFICQVDASLFKTVLLKVFKTKYIQYS